MSHKEEPGDADFKRISYVELGDYLGGRRMLWFKRDYLRPDLAEKIVRRVGVTAAELVQATRLFNIEASFGYVRA